MSRKKVVFQNKWFAVEEEIAKDKKGYFRDGPFYRVRTGSGVAILAVTKKKKIVLVRQYRQALEETTLEIPTGGVDARESSRHAAIRELHEETGYRAKRLVLLARGLPIMGNRISGRTDFFFASDVVLDAGFLAKKPINVKLVSVASFKKMILQNKLRHSSAIVAFQLTAWKRLIR